MRRADRGGERHHDKAKTPSTDQISAAANSSEWSRTIERIVRFAVNFDQGSHNRSRIVGCRTRRNGYEDPAKHLPAGALLASATPAIANEVWSLSGFKAPESVLLDSQRNVLYVSNVAGEANAKDGVGFISKVSPDGKMIEAEWVKGLNAPKGLVMDGDKLYVLRRRPIGRVDVNKGAGNQ